MNGNPGVDSRCVHAEHDSLSTTSLLFWRYTFIQRYFSDFRCVMEELGGGGLGLVLKDTGRLRTLGIKPSTFQHRKCFGCFCTSCEKLLLRYNRGIWKHFEAP